MKWPQRWRVTAAVVAGALSLGLLVHRSWRIDYPYSIDFQAYWLSGKRVANGQADKLYAPGGGPAQGTPTRLPSNEFKNLPIVALVFVPLANLDYLSAKRLFWWIGLLCILGSAVGLGLLVLPASDGNAAGRVGVVVALFCALAPAHTALRHGQTTPLALLTLVGYLVGIARGRPWLAGVSLALGGLIKIPLLLLAGLEVFRSRWTTLAGWLQTMATLVGLSVLVFGLRLHEQYIAGIAAHGGTVMTGHNNQSVAAVVTRLSGPVSALDWQPQQLGPTAWIVALLTTVVLLAIAVTVLVPARGIDVEAVVNRRYLLETSGVLAVGIVALPVAWDHYFLLLAPGIVILGMALRAESDSSRVGIALILVTAVACLALPTPQSVLVRAGELKWVGALWLSHYFFGAVLLLVALAAFQHRSRVTLRATGP